MNGGILKSQKLLAELTIKLDISNQQQKSEMNCPVNVVSYAQIAFKRLIFQARPANVHLNGLVRFLWDIRLFI